VWPSNFSARGIGAVAASTLLYFTLPALARDCGKILVNCQTHEILIDGERLPITCGKGTNSGGGDDATLSGEGTIGSAWVPDLASDPIKDGVDIDGIPGMGKAGGGKIFHCVAGGATPTKDDRSKGCIRVTPRVLSKLHSCQGSRLRIIGAHNPGGTSTGSAAEGASIPPGVSPTSSSSGYRASNPNWNANRRVAPVSGLPQRRPASSGASQEIFNGVPINEIGTTVR
jgi:hypothetical protein